ncbi:MAG: 30S ribosomal protein S17 [Chlorobiota bacterium]
MEEQALHTAESPEPTVPSEEHPQVAQPSPARARRYGRRRVLIGRVVSNKAHKTIVVAIERDVMHPLYKKTYKRTTKVMAHDEHNRCQIGDLVKVVEWRPLSRRKRWMLVEILQRSHQQLSAEEL